MITVFTVGDAGYFLGVVGLVNSLKATGFSGEIVILDCGFTSDQRALLESTCTLHPLPEENRNTLTPHMFKLVAPLSRSYAPDDVIVVIDSDVLVTAPLDELIQAGKNHVVAFTDRASWRWFEEWESLFDLAAPPRHEPYVNSGLVVFAPATFPELLEQWSERGYAVGHLGIMGHGADSGPTMFTDQDALNATLMTDYPLEATYRPDAAKFPMFELIRLMTRVKLVNRATLVCELRGQTCIALHSVSSPKPWRSLKGVWPNPYTTLLVDMTSRDDLPVRPPTHMVPRWLRTDLSGKLLRPIGWLATAINDAVVRARRAYFRTRVSLKLGTRLGLRR